jgi:hypothetical protein
MIHPRMHPQDYRISVLDKYQYEAGFKSFSGDAMLVSNNSSYGQQVGSRLPRRPTPRCCVFISVSCLNACLPAYVLVR